MSDTPTNVQALPSFFTATDSSGVSMPRPGALA